MLLFFKCPSQIFLIFELCSAPHSFKLMWCLFQHFVIVFAVDFDLNLIKILLRYLYTGWPYYGPQKKRFTGGPLILTYKIPVTPFTLLYFSLHTNTEVHITFKHHKPLDQSYQSYCATCLVFSIFFKWKKEKEGISQSTSSSLSKRKRILET
jgi:hypothetical protein